MTEETPWFKPLLDTMIKEMLKVKAVTGAALEAIDAYAKKLIQNAESLYDLSSRDEVWK